MLAQIQHLTTDNRQLTTAPPVTFPLPSPFNPHSSLKQKRVNGQNAAVEDHQTGDQQGYTIS